jgi:hypothetical protein
VWFLETYNKYGLDSISLAFADLVAAFVLENTKACFENATDDGIYRDDCLVVVEKSSNYSR